MSITQILSQNLNFSKKVVRKYVKLNLLAQSLSLENFHDYILK